MRSLLLIIVPALVLSLSCKKDEPKKGYWQITFTDDRGTTGPVVLPLINTEHLSISGSGPHNRFSCTIELSNNKITKGDYYSYSEFSGHYGENHYTEFEGTYNRKQGSGTYKYREESNSGYYFSDTVITGSGTFEIKWLYRKEPKK